MYFCDTWMCVVQLNKNYRKNFSAKNYKASRLITCTNLLLRISTWDEAANHDARGHAWATELRIENDFETVRQSLIKHCLFSVSNVKIRICLKRPNKSANWISFLLIFCSIILLTKLIRVLNVGPVGSWSGILFRLTRTPAIENFSILFMI